MLKSLELIKNCFLSTINLPKRKNREYDDSNSQEGIFSVDGTSNFSKNPYQVLSQIIIHLPYLLSSS